MFPQFNFHSTPLMILVLQGLIFAWLLINRFRKQKMVADLLIAIFLLTMVYHRTTYTIGFMGWYDTFKNTKINYYIFSLGLMSGPLIYLYVRTTLKAPFKFLKKDWWHFLPVGLFFIYRIVILLHDMGQDDWTTGYEGGWQSSFHIQYVAPFQNLFEYSSQLLYLAFTIQLFWNYRNRVKQYFSNTYKLELNWLLLFLAVYSFLFVYSSMSDLVDAFIIQLHYTNKWWYHLFSAIAIVYLGIKAYFTDLTVFQKLTFDILETDTRTSRKPAIDFSKEKKILENYIDSNQPYLLPDFTIKDLAKGTRMSIHQVSEVINSGYGINFNEFVNRYRIEETKKRLVDPDNAHLSIIAVAFDSGFNSKATFNRVFKQFSGQSPSQFRKEHKI